MRRGATFGAVVALALAVAAQLAFAKHPSNIHTVFLTECSLYFQWQSLGMYYSHKKAAQAGPITRVMCCDEKQAAALDPAWRDLGPTHMAPSFTHNPHNNDVYSAYNKPLAVIDFVEKFQPEEDWLLIVDADMTLRLPYICKGEDNGRRDPELEMPCERGRPISAFFGYLIGVTNRLAEKHLPDVEPRQDTDWGQPAKRRADQVGGTLLVHKEDIKKYMHDWLKITEDVRFDPDAWQLTGDVFAAREPGSKPWISEMYGYVFSAAKHGIWHTVDRTSMVYPGYLPAEVPRLMHYGLLFDVQGYKFDKHWHYDFDPMVCPPWGDISKAGGTKGLFPHPPRVSELKAKGGMERLRDLLALDTVNVLNEALCWYHERHCPGVRESDEFKRECGRVNETAEAIRKDLIRIGSILPNEPGSLCFDAQPHAKCKDWAKAGDCKSNAGYMVGNCAFTCGFCRPVLPWAQLWDVPERTLPAWRKGAAPHAHDVVPDLTTSPEVAPDEHSPGAKVAKEAISQELQSPGGDKAEHAPGESERPGKTSPVADDAAAPHIGDDGNGQKQVKTSGPADAPAQRGEDAVARGVEAPKGKSVMQLQRDCLQRQDLGAAQVRACLKAASLRQEYVPAPTRLSSVFTRSRKAHHLNVEQGLQDSDDTAGKPRWRWRNTAKLAVGCVIVWFLSVCGFMLLRRTRRRRRNARPL